MNRLIYDFHRRSYSTDTCLIYSTYFIRKQTDESNLCGMVLLDLQKAFDTENHSILLDKLSVKSFLSTVIAWLASYLTGRVQRVEVGGILSEGKLVNRVPQGCVLGPVLFLLYINHMQVVSNCNSFLYSALLFSDKETSRRQNKLSEVTGCLKTNFYYI